MSYTSTYRVERKRPVRLDAFDASATGEFADHDAARQTMSRDVDRLRTLHTRLFAEKRRALLIVLQSVDAGGKDGLVRHLFAALNPRAATTHAFEPPTPEEAAHDFLWRVHRVVPAYGNVAVFNRSHYEDVLVPRVHGTLDRDALAKRTRRIVGFEKLLVQNGTTILKFFLHISPDEQLCRFEARIDDPDKQWKVDPDDYAERARWPAFRRAYEDLITTTNRKRAPWFVVPANHKWFRNLVATRIAIETLEALDPHAPPPAARRPRSCAGSCTKRPRADGVHAVPVRVRAGYGRRIDARITRSRSEGGNIATMLPARAEPPSRYVARGFGARTACRIARLTRSTGIPARSSRSVWAKTASTCGP